MAENSKIEWTTHTFNPWRGCTKVSAGCAHCYADTLSKRNPQTLGVWGPNGTRVVAAESAWREPVKWNRLAAWCGNPVCKGREPLGLNRCSCGLDVERPRVFCASLADVFEGPETMPAESVPTIVAARHRLLDLIAHTPNLDWLLLTKRPQNITRLWDEAARHREGEESGPSLAMPLPNVWLGTSVENQEAADARIPELLRVPAAVRFLSCEPLLGPVRIDELLVPFGDSQAVVCPLSGEWAPREPSPIGDATIGWVIVGGESGHGARPLNVEWVRSIVAQCKAAGVPVFVKQLGAVPTFTEYLGGWPKHVEYRKDTPSTNIIRLRDPKGGDWNEWGAEFQVREFPAPAEITP